MVFGRLTKKSGLHKKRGCVLAAGRATGTQPHTSGYYILMILVSIYLMTLTALVVPSVKVVTMMVRPLACCIS